VNQSLGDFLRSFVTKHHSQWHQILGQAKFPYNESVNRSTRKTPFQVVYGMNPRGVSELRDIDKSEFRSVGAEDFAAEMQKLHNHIKEKLRRRTSEYKHIVDQHKSKLQFEVEDQFLEHLRKEMFPRGTYNKRKMKKIGPCKILRKFVENYYEIEFPEDVGISPIFNIAYIYPYREDGIGGPEDQKKIKWRNHMPVEEKP
jgi:hypothetical protein